MNDSLILSEKIDDAVWRLTLNRPEKRNALNIALMDALIEQLDRASAEPTCRVVWLQGAGAVFCAGLDLKEAADSSRSHHMAQRVAKLLQTLAQQPQVTVATAHGAAMAGGAGLLTACDLALCGSSCLIGYPEVRRGLVAALVLHSLITQVGERAARELLVTGAPISAHRAYEMGLINRTVNDEELEIEAMAMIQEVLKGAPGAILQSKKLIDRLHSPTAHHAIEEALDAHLEMRDSTEADEGLVAYAEKRAPHWEIKLEAVR